jgi:hypothetical protein
MKTFKQLISENTTAQTEDAKTTQSKNLHHIEDHSFLNGKSGTEHALKTLGEMHNNLSGQKSEVKIGTKFVGGEPLIFGRMPKGHPKEGQHFVSTKTNNSPNPKVNYSLEDIVRNHGDNPKLVEKLNSALEHTPKLGLKHGDMYQGDVMYTQSDIRDDGKKVSFAPNKLSYSTDKNSEEGKKIDKAKIGIAVHTKHEGDETGNLEGYRAHLMPDLSKLKQHPDIHIISTESKVNPEKYNSQQKADFEKHMTMAGDLLHDTMDDSSHSAIKPHSNLISAYTNTEVERNGVPNHEDFMDYANEKGMKEISKLKSQSAIDRKTQLHKTKMADLKKNKSHFENLFRLHKQLQSAKNVLTSVANANKTYSTSVDGLPSDGEGFVVVHPKKNIIDKVVDRSKS